MKNDSTSHAVLRIFISSTDKYKDKLLYEYIVFKAKENGLSGATVYKGILGYGASSVIHSVKFWEVSEKVPTIIEIIDNKETVCHFYEVLKPDLEAMRYGCLVTLENCNLLLYKSGRKHI